MLPFVVGEYPLYKAILPAVYSVSHDREQSMSTITRPDPAEYFEYFETYISKFTPDDFWAEFDGQPDRLRSLVGACLRVKNQDCTVPTRGP